MVFKILSDQSRVSRTDRPQLFEPPGGLVWAPIMGGCGGLGLRCPDGGRPEADRSREGRKLGGVVHGAAVAKATVGPPRIVVDAEVLDDDP